MTDVTNERWMQHSTILTLKGELAQAHAEIRTLRNASVTLLERAEKAEALIAKLKALTDDDYSQWNGEAVASYFKDALEDKS